MAKSNGWAWFLGGLALGVGGYALYACSKDNRGQQQLTGRVALVEGRVKALDGRIGSAEMDLRLLRVQGQNVSERVAHVEGYLIPPPAP